MAFCGRINLKKKPEYGIDVRWAMVSNYIHLKLWDVINHLCLSIYGTLDNRFWSEQ